MRRRYDTLALTLLAYAVAVVQRPGQVIADTKVDLYVDPQRFVSNVLSVWSPTVDLGHLFGAQYSGYAWPMGPWFAAGDGLGLPVWLVHRLWLGTIFAVAAIGVVRLLRALAADRSPVLHNVAAALYIINPYTTVYVDRTSITLLTYAALPWMLLAVHRGLRDPGRWRWPAVFALVLTSTGGGVNVAVTAWVLLGPAILVLYELWWGGVDRTAAFRWVWRTALAATVAQLWWVIPVAIQASGAPNFLPFTEQPGTIWSTTSLSESLRMMGFWTSYVGVGYDGHLRPFQASAPAMLHLLPVVLAGLALGGGALAGFPLVRRWRYAPFFGLLALVGLLIMTVGWPEGTPLRTAATGVYYRVDAVDFLRTTYKGGAIAALGITVLAGAAVDALWGRAGSGRRRALVGAGAGLIAVLAAWPLVSGRAVDRQLAFNVPAAWKQVGRDLDKPAGDTRAMGFPGSLFGFYDWGGTVDPILPTLTKRPTVSRWIVPYSDLRATDLQWTTDSLITQDRLRPRQLGPLLDLMSVGDVVVNTDGDRARGGEAPAGQVSRALQRQRLGADTAYGSLARAPVTADSSDRRPLLPRLARIRRSAPPMVSLLPRHPLTVVDGGAGGIAALASFGDLNPREPIVYAPDLTPAEIRSAAAAGGSIVISDTNRRAAFVASRLIGSRGPTLPIDQGISVDGTLLDPWFGSPDNETVQELKGVASLEAPASPQVTQFPERRPYAALDGDPSTAWMADRALEKPRHRLTVRFDEARDVPTIDLLPYSDSRGVVQQVMVNGHRFKVGRGWNRLPVKLSGVSALTIVLSKVTKPKDAKGGAGGIRELRIPGVHVTETIRPPVTAARALRGADLDRASLTYLLARQAADRPSRQRRYVGERGAADLRDAQDAELLLRRVLDVPDARTFTIDGWASLDPRLSDSAIDDLIAGRLPRERVQAGQAKSSSRYEGLGRFRASGAFDRGRRAWVGQWIAGRPAWVEWRTSEPQRVSRLTLESVAGLRVRSPTRVAVVADGVRGPVVNVGDDGLVVLPKPVLAQAIRLEIVAARFPAGTTGLQRQRRAVGIGEIRGTGMPQASNGRRVVSLPCGAAVVAVDGRRRPLRTTTTRSALEGGGGVRLRGCARATVAAGRRVVVDRAGPLRVDALRIRSLAPNAVARAPVTPGRVESPGVATGDGGREGARIDVSAPAWLVLGQSFSHDWRANCDGRDLGTPRPIQGYANGWKIASGCEDLTFSFGPQRVVRAGYLISLLGCLLLLVILAVGRVRRRGRPEEEARVLGDLPVARAPRLRGPVGAAFAAGLSAVVIGATFGLRAGAVAFPILVWMFWRGISDRVLSWAAALLLLAAVPATYVVVAVLEWGEHHGGNDTNFGVDRLAAHWMAVGGVLCFAVLLFRTLSTARVRGEPSAGSGS